MSIFDGIGNIIGINDPSSDAISAQTAGASQADATQMAMFNQTQANEQPWLQAGASALKQMQDPKFQQNFSMADFQADPAYQYDLDQGQQAIERSAAAKGGLASGGTLKDLTSYAQGMASNEYQNAYNRYNNDNTTNYNRLATLAGAGQTATSQVNAAGTSTANNVSQTEAGLGNADAANIMGAAKSDNQMVSQGLAMAFSDERLKKDIKPIAKEDLAEMKANLKAYSFKYKNEMHGKGEHIGVMAQDLAKSKLGRTFIVNDKDGYMQIDLGKLMMFFLATLAEG